MGTSSGYDMPKGEQWRELRDDVDKFLKSLLDEAAKKLIDEAAKDMFRSYVRANGGAESMARGEVPDADGRKAKTPSAACVVSAKIGRVLASATSGSSGGRISIDLLEPTQPARTLDEYAARQALLDILDVSQDATDLSEILGKFLGAYLYHRFRRDSYELCVEKQGVQQAALSLERVRRFIEDFASAKVATEMVAAGDWERNSLPLSEQIFKHILEGLDEQNEDRH